MTHELKTWPEYFNRIAIGQKKFEVRKNDRDFQVGDNLFLREYDPKSQSFSGGTFDVKVTYILYGGSFGIEPGYCVMGIEPM